MQRLSEMGELQADLDIRLLPLWQDIGEIEDERTRDVVIAFARYAYYRGYVDAWVEPRVASLLIDHGQPVPTRQTS